MIKKTKNKFIAIAMLSVTLVLAVLMTVLNTLNYARLDQEAAELLSFLAENGGRFPEKESGAPGGKASGEMTASGEMAVTGEIAVTGEMGASGEPGMGRSGEPKSQRRTFTEETPYETRYFSVTLAADGTVLSSDTTQIAAVTAAQAEEIARSLHAAGRQDGYYVNYKFVAQTAADGVQYVFLDCTTDRSAAENFLKTSVLVSLCGMAVFFLLVLVLSAWVIRPMEVAYDKQKSFITNAGHELKTPLAVIGSCTEVLELEQGENKWTDAIRAQVTRMGDLTQNLIALARLDEGVRLPEAEFDLSAAVKEELEMFLPLAQQKGLGFRMDIQQDVVFNGNESALRQLTVILADNAVKYAPEGEVFFRLSRKGKKVILQSENPAEGFMPGEQRQLFERFYRGDASHNQENSGYGVGLSIAEAIVRAHGGNISAVSEDGKSLCVTVSL